MRKRVIGRIQHMARAKNLRGQLIRGGIGSGGIQVLNRALMLATGIVFARGLGAEGYGVYAYAFALMSLLSVIAEAGVPTLLMREVAASHARNEWGILRGVLTRSAQLVVLVSVSVSIVGLIVLWAAAGSMHSEAIYTIGLMLLVLPLSALSKTLARAIFGLRRVVTGQSLVMVLRPALVLLALGVTFFLFPSLREPQFAMAAQLGSAFLVLIIGLRVLIHILPHQTLTVTPEFYTRVWLRSVPPFVLIGGADIINNQADIIMLGWFTSSQDVGIYRVAVQGAVLVALSMRIVGTICSPHFARLYAAGESVRLQKIVTYGGRAALLASFPIAIAFIFGGNLIAGWVFGSEFALSHLPMAILAVGQLGGIALGPAGFLLNMTGYERITARALWQTAALNVALNSILIPFLGAAGAATATTISLLVMNLLLFIQVKKRLKLKPSPLTAGLPNF